MRLENNRNSFHQRCGYRNVYYLHVFGFEDKDDSTFRSIVSFGKLQREEDRTDEEMINSLSQ